MERENDREAPLIETRHAFFASQRVIRIVVPFAVGGELKLFGSGVSFEEYEHVIGSERRARIDDRDGR